MTLMSEDHSEKLKKVERFVQKVRDLVGQGSNYSNLKINTERYNNGATIENNPDLHNCVRARVYIRPGEYNTHLDVEEVRQRAEEIAAIASGQRATTVTKTREAREEKPKKYHESYPGPVTVGEIGGTKNRGYPIFELEYTVPVFGEQES